MREGVTMILREHLAERSCNTLVQITDNQVEELAVTSSRGGRWHNIFPTSLQSLESLRVISEVG